MRLAFLGTDPDAMALLAAALASGHDVVWLGDVRPEDNETLQRLVPGVSPSHEWELLLDHKLVDAVVVGRGTAGDELRAEQLKRFVDDAVPLLVVHPVVQSVLTYYEVDMVRRETGAIVLHYNPAADHPLVGDLARAVREGHDTVGSIHQVTCQRYLDDCHGPAVLGQLARDAELLGAVVGDIRTVTAIGPRSGQGSYASMQVQMTSPGEATLRWSVAPPAPDAGSGAKLTLVGERGTATLRIVADAACGFEWELEVQSAGETWLHPVPPFDAAAKAIGDLAAAVAAGEAALTDWDAATRAMEVVDTVELSLQKGRTIEIHHQQLTQQLAFRGTMAALGCGLLLLGTVALFAIGIAGDVVGVPLPGSWPWVLLGLLGLFLSLQALPLLLPRKRG